MKKNIGTVDRVVRLILGLLCLIAAWYVGALIFKVLLVILGLFSIYEALAGWCLFYMIIGRNTCPLE